MTLAIPPTPPPTPKTPANDQTPVKKKKTFTFDADVPKMDKRHTKLTEDQMKAVKEKFVKKGNS